MKEKIIIDKELLEKIIKASPIQWFDNKEKTKNLVLFGKEYKTEKYPTNWEELKELCKKENISIWEDEIKIKWHNNTSLYFYEKDGEIICKDEDSCIEMIIGYDRTPAQMWQIIKSLIGEE